MMADLKVIPDGHRKGRPTFTVIISDYGPVTFPWQSSPDSEPEA